MYASHSYVCNPVPLRTVYDFARRFLSLRPGNIASNKVVLSSNLSPVDHGLIERLTNELTLLREENSVLKSNEHLHAENDRNYRDLVEGSNQGIIIHRNFEFVFVNSMFAEIHGFQSIDEVMAKKSILEMVPEQTKLMFRDHLDNRLRGDPAPNLFEYEGTKKDGSSIWLENVVRKVNWEGEPAVQATIIDVTERKRAQQKLKISEERFRTYASIGADWMWETDDRDCFIYVSNSFFERLQISPVDVIGKSRKSWINEESMAGHAVTWQQHLSDIENRRPFNEIEYQMNDYDGAVVHITMSGVPVYDKNGVFTGYRGTSRDITERFETERLKSEFISTVSHELRTPLTTIRGSLRLITGGAFGDIPAQMRDIVALADDNAARLHELVNDLLDIGKIRRQQLSFYMTNVALDEIVADCLKQFKLRFEKANVEVSIPNCHSQAMVWGDRKRLCQVLGHLLSNAIKFSPANSVISLDLSKAGEKLRLSIADNGPGIPKHFQNDLFKQFTQEDASDTRATGGTGLGLTMAKSIIEHHGGELGFSTEVGQGSTFFFDLPARKT